MLEIIILVIAALLILWLLWKLAIKPLLKFLLMAIIVFIALIFAAKFFNLF